LNDFLSGNSEISHQNKTKYVR